MTRDRNYDADPILDARARRAARRAGLRVCKSRQRIPHINNRGGYQLIDWSNTVVGGVDYDMTADEVIQFCERHGVCERVTLATAPGAVRQSAATK